MAIKRQIYRNAATDSLLAREGKELNGYITENCCRGETKQQQKTHDRKTERKKVR